MNSISTILALIFLSVVLLLLFIVYTLRQREKYYKNLGIPYTGAGLSRIYRTLTGAINFISMEEECYKEAIEQGQPIVAMSEAGGSCIYVTDLDMLRKIMVKDFDHFVNLRPIDTQKSSKYFTKMLFMMKDDQWKSTRGKMTPAFTTGKIKRMFKIFQTSAERMDSYLKGQIKHSEKLSMDVDFLKVLFKYSMDVIANCAFGIESNGWEIPMDKFSQFEWNGKKFESKFDVKILLKFIVMTMAPWLADMLELEVLDAGAQKYFEEIVKKVLKQRRTTGERRDDFLQLMMDIQQGTLKAEDDENSTIDANDKFVFDDEYLIANALMFFLGGFDTTQTALLFTIYSLALEPEVQERLYQEVKEQMDKNAGKLSYESLSEMMYLDMVINETLRMYPAAARSERYCTKDYFVEETGFTIEKGTIIAIPIHGIHNDSRYYPNPEKYEPERFTPENKANRHQYAFLPFGHGPRSCPGLRFALANVKAIVAQVVYSYKLEPCSKTLIPMKFDESSSAKPKGGCLWLSVTVRDS